MLRVTSILYLEHIWTRPKIEIENDTSESIAGSNTNLSQCQDESITVEEETCLSDEAISIYVTKDSHIELHQNLKPPSVEFIEEGDNLTVTSSLEESIQSETPVTNDEDLEERSNTSSAKKKFSPKKILSRARSSITEESVRKLGRRTSVLFDKIIHTDQGSKNQPSKLATKKKSFTKKLKRVMSFHQNPQSTLV